ncbi:MAG: hypothetical protein H6658_14270 [Ardenticatenaceae bacterium]|nr:hypothetical protein [Ardenticatenaceae bacterium]
MSSYPYYPEERQEFPVLGVVSAWLGFGAVVATAVRRIIVIDPTSQWADPLLSIITASVIALTLASALYVRYSGPINLKLAAIPLFINISTLLVVYLVPFAEIWQDLRFQWRWDDYNEVVRLVEAGQISAGAMGEAQLPDTYGYLSVNGRIHISRQAEATYIFFTSRTTSQTTGYLYAGNNQLPSSANWHSGWQYVVQKRPNWFLCAMP